MGHNRYDVAIIGSGIGGLVCGNYLAKAGKKVLILEKNGFPGGCCSSFINDGFFFDSGAHLINGEIFGILKELKIYNEKDYTRLDPTAVFCFDNKKYFFKNEYKDFICYLKSQFPQEDLDTFFSLMEKKYLYLYYKLKNMTFQDLLDRYFKDSKIKILFYSFIFSRGTVPEKISAVIALKILKSIFTYGGFYPNGGMQSLSNRLADNLYRNEGRIIFNNAVKRIFIKNGRAYGLLGPNNEEFNADIIASNISPINTLVNLIKPMKSTGIINKKMSKMKLADSAFAVHIALKKNTNIFCENTSYFIAGSGDYKKNIELYHAKSLLYKPFGFICALNGNFQNKDKLNNNKSLNLITVIYYKPKKFWNKCKEMIADAMIEDMEKIFPGFRDNILFKKITTPFDIEHYTGNNNGSIGGWAMTPAQTGLWVFPYKSRIKNLYFTGHWTFPGTGISSAAISGRNAAQLIINSNKC